MGPYSLEQLKSMVANSNIAISDVYSECGADKWKPLSELLKPKDINTQMENKTGEWSDQGVLGVILIIVTVVSIFVFLIAMRG